MINKNRISILISFLIFIILLMYIIKNIVISLPSAGGQPKTAIILIIISTIIMGILEVFKGNVFPIIKGLRETKVLRGFIYNALIVSLVSGFAIYVSKYLEKSVDQDLRGHGPFFGFSFQSGILGARMELISIVLSSFIFSMFFYLLFHIIFGFGESMVVP